MSLQYIRDYYKVPAKRGGRIRFLDFKGLHVEGTITGAEMGRLRVRMDGESMIGTYHPTWQLEYI
jgi:hypothetical protein